MTAWALIAALGVATYALRAAGPLGLGAARLPAWIERPLPYVTPAVLAGLVVTATFAVEDELVLDERAFGLGVAAVAIVLRAPVLVVVVAAAAATAVARL
ncbi:MAG: AzlD domain-containing protein [Thermoleophilaceae bacterium]